MRARGFLDKPICVSEWAEYACPPRSLKSAHQWNEVTDSQAKKEGGYSEKDPRDGIRDDVHHVCFTLDLKLTCHPR